MTTRAEALERLKLCMGEAVSWHRRTCSGGEECRMHNRWTQALAAVELAGAEEAEDQLDVCRRANGELGISNVELRGDLADARAAIREAATLIEMMRNDVTLYPLPGMNRWLALLAVRAARAKLKEPQKERPS